MAPRKRRSPSEAPRIEIERNPIERFLLKVNAFVKTYRRQVLYGVAALLVIGAVAIATVIAVHTINTRNEERFAEIMNDRVVAAIVKGDDASSAIKDLKAFIDSAYFGYSLSLAYYSLGNIYFNRKEYGKAKENLLTYAEREPRTILAPLAMLKAAVALEESGDFKGAIALYRRLEERYGDGPFGDQIYYNYARVSGRVNDLYTARAYYKKVITTYPESAFTALARKRLFLLGVR